MMKFDKKTARNMFVAGSLLLAVALLLLTVSFHRRLDERTQADTLLTDSAVRGKEVWENKNCTNCHARLGEGAYHAPDLTRAITRRGESWMTHFLKDPVTAYYGTEANAVGRRKMPNLHLKDEEIADLLSFFRFIEGMDTNGWPPPETVRVRGVPVPTEGEIAEGAQHFAALGCKSCHAVNGSEVVENKGPDLTFAASRLTHAWMVSEILEPQKDFPETAMPHFGEALTPEMAERLVQYLEWVNLANGGLANGQASVPAPRESAVQTAAVE
jgi:nitric oxide reductase subunit C